MAERTAPLCYRAYAVLASGVTRGALRLAEHPTAAGLAAACQTQQVNLFHPENGLPPADRAELADYLRSGLDRSNMTSSSDMPDPLAQQQSFSLANIVPQTAKLNRSVWERIENAVRTLVKRQGEAYVVTGPAFQGANLQQIGGRVLVPSLTWKAIYVPATGNAGTWSCTNTVVPACTVLSVAALAAQTTVFLAAHPVLLHHQRKRTGGNIMRRMTLSLGLLALASPALAQVSRFDVIEDVPAFAGRSFGNAGTYRRITARATIALDPADPHNAVIADLLLAPRTPDGKVEATADVVILTPADPAFASGTMLLDVPNRGRKLAPELFDDSPQPGATRADQASDAGNGFLYGRGTTLVWVGWQGDIPSASGQLAMQAPVLAGVTGRVREEFVFDNTTSPMTVTPEWKLATTPDLAVSVRPAWADPRQTPAGLSVRAVDDQRVEITRPDTGFDAGALYELTYTGRDPAVLGMGYAMTRDVATFLRRETGTANPLAAHGKSLVDRAILFGVSQSGRFVRDYLYFGFNQDTAGRIVFDGMMPHVGGARRMATNVRFGQPGRNARHPQDPAWQADEFPFTYGVLDDQLSGRRDGLLLRCQLSNSCPLVMQTDSEHEWWASRASLLVTDTHGTPIDLPANVRAYMLTGTTHFETPGGTSRRIAAAAAPTNPLHNGPTMRALFVDMEQWIREGRLPPSTRVPMRSQGTLVTASEALPQSIPGLPYSGIYTPAAFSDQSVPPPREIGRYPVFVPRLDTDGIAIAGIHQLSVLVPRATYTGWNPRAPGFGSTALFPLQGTMLSFARTEAERRSNGDPRQSIAERYGDDADYQRALNEGAARLMAERLLLKQDAPAEH